MSDNQDTAPQVRRRRYNRLAAASVATAVAGAGVLMFGLTATSASAAPQDKITICHRDANNKKPYGPKAITVSENSILKPNGHATHTGPVWDPTLKGLGIQWGDIIPPFDFDGGSFPGLNWTTAGQAIFNNNCQIPGEVTSTPTDTVPVTDTGTPTDTASVSASETSNPPASTAVTTVTETAAAAPSSEAIPNGVAAGLHTTNGTDTALLGGVLMALGLGGVATAVRPWKRGTH